MIPELFPLGVLSGTESISHCWVLTSALSTSADGWIHKAVVLGSGMHIIEEIQVFREPQSVDNLVISPMQVVWPQYPNRKGDWGGWAETWVSDRLSSLVPAQPLRGGCNWSHPVSSVQLLTLPFLL